MQCMAIFYWTVNNIGSGVPGEKKNVCDFFMVFGAFPVLFGVKNNVLAFIFS